MRGGSKRCYRKAVRSKLSKNIRKRVRKCAQPYIVLEESFETFKMHLLNFHNNFHKNWRSSRHFTVPFWLRRVGRDSPWGRHFVCFALPSKVAGNTKRFLQKKIKIVRRNLLCAREGDFFGFFASTDEKNDGKWPASRTKPIALFVHMSCKYSTCSLNLTILYCSLGHDSVSKKIF